MPEDKKELRIGIVDNHIQTAIGISNMLENAGYKTYQAYTADDGIELCKKEKLPIMIFDTNLLPDLDGKICFLSTKIVLVGFQTGKIKECEKKVIGFVKKPIEIDELLRILKKSSK